MYVYYYYPIEGPPSNELIDRRSGKIFLEKWGKKSVKVGNISGKVEKISGKVETSSFESHHCHFASMGPLLPAINGSMHCANSKLAASSSFSFSSPRKLK